MPWIAVDIQSEKYYGPFDAESEAQAKVDELISDYDEEGEEDPDSIAIVCEQATA